MTDESDKDGSAQRLKFQKICNIFPLHITITMKEHLYEH